MRTRAQPDRGHYSIDALGGAKERSDRIPDGLCSGIHVGLIEGLARAPAMPILPGATAPRRFGRNATLQSRASCLRDEVTLPNIQLLDSLPPLLVFVAFALVAMLFYEAGFRLGRWWQDRTPGEQEGPTGMLVGSILALLAFLLAVTMGMAADRFDARRGSF